MRYIEKADYTGKRHVEGDYPDRTECGLILKESVTGECIAPMIECKRCRWMMREDGYRV